MTPTYEMRLRDLWDVLRRRRRIVLGALILGLALGLTASLFRPALYRASATITLDKVPPQASVLVLTHNPDIFPDVPDRVALTIAGHTHGGQVRVPLVGRPIVPSAHGERFAIGTVVDGGRHLFVTPGVGTSILPVRFLVPPEISVLELRPSVETPLRASGRSTY